MIKEHERVVLTTAISDEILESGDVGTVVHVYSDRQAYEVEFVALDGHTTAVVTVESHQIRPVTPRDMTHTREIQAV
jgi:DNA polymerase III sliding clamp (beta) subunit (PCNA family)